MFFVLLIYYFEDVEMDLWLSFVESDIYFLTSKCHVEVKICFGQLKILVRFLIN